MKIKDKIILTDCDGVLCEWNNPFEEFMGSKGYNKIPNTDDEYNLGKRFGVSSKLALQNVKEFNESDRIINLKPFADSSIYVPKLVNYGFKFIVISSISDAPNAKNNRVKNLIQNFGNIFQDIICIPIGASKTSALSEWADSGYFWIEDHMAHAESGYEVGLKPILINHPYNNHYQTDLFPKVNFKKPWAEIYKIILNDYKKSIFK